MISNLISYINHHFNIVKAVSLFDEGHALHRAGRFQEAEPLLRQAAEYGYLNAMAICGSMNLLGQGLPENGKKALYWLEQAAEGDHQDAKSMLGMALATGKAGIKRDMARAVQLLTQCAEKGDEQSQRMLGMIERGEGMFKKKPR